MSSTKFIQIHGNGDGFTPCHDTAHQNYQAFRSDIEQHVERVSDISPVWDMADGLFIWTNSSFVTDELPLLIKKHGLEAYVWDLEYPQWIVDGEAATFVE